MIESAAKFVPILFVLNNDGYRENALAITSVEFNSFKTCQYAAEDMASKIRNNTYQVPAKNNAFGVLVFANVDVD